eukprot:scaffold2047_cov119-Isochrysis_galbana.AAC.10
MSILACVAWAKTAASVPLEPLMLYEATSSGPSPGKPRVASKTRAGVVRRVLWRGGALGVLVEAFLAVGAEALDGRVGLEVALDRARAFAVGVVLPRAGEVVERGALLALLVEEANAISEALAWLGWGGAEGVADVEVLGFGAADLAIVVLLLIEGARANAHVVALGH